MDFDDTLVETSRFRKGLLESSIRSWQGIAAEVPVRLDWGAPFRRLVSRFVGDDISDFLQYYLCSMAQNPTRALPGIPEFLDVAKSADVPVVLLSSSITPLINADLVNLGLEDSIAAIFDSDSTLAVKPDPRTLAVPMDWISSRVGFPSPRCLYVGDSLADYECARAQTEFYAVLTGSTSRSEFLAAGMKEDRVLSEITELPLRELVRHGA